MICPWCKTDSDEAFLQHEGPHATWCPFYRAPTIEPLPPLLNRARLVFRTDPAQVRQVAATVGTDAVLRFAELCPGPFNIEEALDALINELIRQRCKLSG